MFVNGCHIQISVLTLKIVCLFCVQYANCTHKGRENRHLFPLLGYLHGYKIGQNFAYQLPPLVLSPVLILPSVNQQQSVNVQKSTAGENYQENGGTFQIISPSKLISNITKANYKDVAVEGTEQKEATKNYVLEEADLSTKNNLSDSDVDTFRQVATNDIEMTTVIPTEIDTENTTLVTDATESKMQNLEMTTQLDGPYPTAVYKNENISTLSITTAPLKENSTVPLLQYNLTLPNIGINENFNRQSIGMQQKTNIYPATTVHSAFRGYSYPNPGYNPVADKLSITTNSYTNYDPRLPPAYDDRWQSFSSLRKSYPTSDFRPLAGLYHDGFLHKHLIKKTGFIPVNEIKDEVEEKLEEPKKKGRKNPPKKIPPKEVLDEEDDEEMKEEAPANKKRKGAKKEEKRKDASKQEEEDEDIPPEAKPVKGKRGQKKAADKSANTEKVQDTGEPTTKRRRKVDEKGN